MNNLSLKKFLYLSLVIHLVALLLGAYLSRSSTIRKEFLVLGAYSKRPARTLLKTFNQPVPFVRESGNSDGKNASGSGIQKGTVTAKKQPVVKQSATKQVVAKKQPAPKKVVPVKKAPVKKVSPPKKTTPAHQPSNTIDTAAWKNAVIKNPFTEKGAAKKKVKQAEKKVVQEKPKTVDKKIVEKKEEKSEVKPKAIEEQKPIEKDLLIPIPPVVPKTLKTSASADPLSGDLEGDTDAQGVVIELDFYHKDSSEMGVREKLIQQEVDRVWRPPFGVAKGTECRVLVTVAPDGHVKDVQLISKSKVLIFDLSVLRDIRSMKLDKNFGGKRFSICFRQ
jgi:outer membrane biosynthesis protein TonB